MSFLNTEKLTELLDNPSELRTRLRKLSYTASTRGRVGAFALHATEQGYRLTVSSTVEGHDVAPSSLLDDISTGMPGTELIASVRVRGTRADELIHPIQLRQYAEYVTAHPPAVGASVSAIHAGQITLKLFNQPEMGFNPIPLLALDPEMPPEATQRAIRVSGLVTITLGFHSSSMVPETGLQDIARLF